MDEEPVTAADIAALTAWARHLTTTGIQTADPGEIAAFQTAKTELLARIRTQNPDTAQDAEDTQ